MAAQALNYLLPEVCHSSTSVPPSTIPGSDLDSSRPESSLCSAVPSSEQAHSSRKRSARLAPTSFNLLGLGRIPREFSSLIRSHSNSTRGQQNASTEANLPQMGYADRPSFTVERPLASVDMFETPIDDERASRKTKSSSRFYNFLTLSRSRSKSKAEDSTSTNKMAIPPLPSKEPLSQQNPNQTERSYSPGDKLPTHVQSRPLSSTTTATNTTITPANIRGKKPAPSAIPIRTPGSKSKRKEDVPISPTKAAPRQKKHTFFGITLPSSHKSLLGSRPATPAPVQSGDDAPLLPLKTHPIVTNDPITLSSPGSRPTTPSAARPSRKPKECSSSTTASATTASTAPTSTSSRLESMLRSPKFFSVRSSSKIPRNPTPVSQTSPPLTVSPPSKIPHPIAKRTPRLSTGSQATPTEPMRQALSPVLIPASPADTSVNTPVPTPPKIVQTPAMPLRSVAPPSENPTLDSSVHSRAQILRMTTIDEGKRSTSSIGCVSASSIGRGSAKGSHTSRFGSRIAMPIGISRGIKHGSFDFERPGYSGSIARTGSVGTATSASLNRDGGEGPSTSVLRDSVVGPGLAGVGTLQREMSIKRASEEEKAKKRVFEKKHRKAVSLQTQLPPLPQATLLADPVYGSTSTAHTEATANTKTSSWGKAAGKKAFFSTSARLGLSHGPFAFEPAVPSPTGSTTTRGENDLSRTNSIQDKPRASEVLREKYRKGHKADRPAVPVPTSSTKPPLPSPSTVGYRSGLKGRSLDLNLGLAWAPTKVREDALLPSSTFFSRTFSGSSSLAGRSNASGSLSSLSPPFGRERSRSGSTSGKRGPEVGELGEKTLTSVGQEVAEMFRNALDTDGYAAFKQHVYRFDAHEIPFHGATGIVAQVERLLDKRATNIDEQGKRQLLDDFIRIVLRNT